MQAPFDVVAAVKASKAKNIRVTPCASNRASELGHPCERYLVLCRTCWQQKQPHSVDTEFIFEQGREIEKQSLRELEDAGFHVIEQQVTLAIPELNITGHLDAEISQNGGAKYPFECKSMNEHIWKRVNTLDDLSNSRQHWLRKYPAQITLYCHMKHAPMGLLYLKNKSNGQPKALWVDYDLNYANELLVKAQRINNYVAAGTVPARIEEAAVCERCDFSHVCNPDIIGAGVEIMDSAEREAMLERRHELQAIVKEPNKELEEINDELKLAFEGKGDLLVGKWHVTGKSVSRKGFTVNASTHWSWKAVKVE